MTLKKDIFEFVYTILTRTSSVLIIAVCQAVHAKFAEALGLLIQDESKIIVWDEETKREVDSLKKGVFPTIDDEEADDSEAVGEADGSTTLAEM